MSTTTGPGRPVVAKGLAPRRTDAVRRHVQEVQGAPVVIRASGFWDRLAAPESPLNLQQIAVDEGVGVTDGIAVDDVRYLQLQLNDGPEFLAGQCVLQNRAFVGEAFRGLQQPLNQPVFVAV